MTSLQKFLDGKKTYACAFLGAVVVFLNLAGFIDSGLTQTLLGLFGFGAVASLRAAK